MGLITATRYHDISTGHRVSGHENKCAHIHGHNYRFHFTVATDKLDSLGRVMDFSVIKEKLCEWLEVNYDHKFLMWKKDPLIKEMTALVPNDIVETYFNPTAENMAQHLVEVIAPKQLEGTGCKLIKCVIDETRKCSAAYEIKY
jgi:6-pyruvoyltetrahydropterin/6-carboxytetrahydropterin synthase